MTVPRPWQQRPFDSWPVEIDGAAVVLNLLGLPVNRAGVEAQLGYPVAEASEAEQRAIYATLTAVLNAYEARLTSPGGDP